MPAGSSGSNRVLIVAASARALAASARRAGYEIAALDQFGDDDLTAVAFAAKRIVRAPKGGFATRALILAANEIAPPFAEPPFGLVYGSGFEDRPDVLARLAKGRRLFGNAPETLARSKDPVTLAAILDELGLAHPETRIARPPQTEGWLAKRIGGSGGVHIRPASQATGDAMTYYQRSIVGTPVSALVIGNGHEAAVLGLSEQWTAPSPNMPFRFGGAAAPAKLAPELQHRMTDAALVLARKLGLIGLNSVDFIADLKHGDFSVIEINPRPGATLDIFERLGGVSLFDLHRRACCGEALPVRETSDQGRAAATAILYTKEEILVPSGFDWPEWAADLPKAQTRIKADEPVCTVMAEGPSAAAARQTALSRAEALRAAISRCMQSPLAREPVPLRERGERLRQFIRKRDS